MKKLSVKILFVSVFACVCALSVSAQCVDDAKKAEKLKKTFDAKGVQDGIQFLTDEIGKTPNCFWFYFKRGSLNLISENFDEGFADLRKGLKTVDLTTNSLWETEKKYFTENYEWLQYRLSEVGSKANKKQNNQVCINAFSFALELRKTKDKKYWDYLFGRGDCFFTSGNSEAASADYLQGIELMENPADSIRVVNAILKLPKISHIEKFHLLGCRLRSKTSDFEGAIADCDEALKIDPTLSAAKQLLADARKNNANKKVEQENEARLAEDQRRMEEIAVRLKLKKNDPQLYEILRLAIEDKNAEAISGIMIGTDFTDCLACDYDHVYSTNRMGPFSTQIERPEIGFMLNGKKADVFVVRRIVGEINNMNHYDSQGRFLGNSSDTMFSGKYGYGYSTKFSGGTFDLTPTRIKRPNGEDLESLSEYLSRNDATVRSYRNSCECDPRVYLRKAEDWVDELRNITRIEVDRIGWDGEVSVTAYAAGGKDYKFYGKVSKIVKALSY